MSTTVEIKSKEIEMISVNSLIHHPKNMNEHSEDQINRLVKLIEYQGFRNPLVVQMGTDLVVAGNGRLMAARKMGLAYVPVTYQEFDSEAQLYAYMTSDNAIASWAHLDLSKINSEMLDFGPDFDIDMLGIKDFVIEPIEKFEPQGDEDEVPEVIHPITRRGDIWLLGNHRLMCGDSTMIDDVEKLMNGEKADMVFTSPPYSDMREYNGEKDLTVSNIAEFITTFKLFSQMFVVNLGIQRKNGEVFEYWNEYIQKARDNGLKLSSWNIWNREGMGGSVGNMTAMFPIEHEWIFVFSNGEIELNKTKENVSSKKNKSVTNRKKDGSTEKKIVSVNGMGKIGTVASFDFDRFTGGERSHPAQFPASLAESYLAACSNNSAIDPFGGGGTTIIACENIGRKCFSMELDEKYCDVIINRWMNYTGRSDVKLESTGELYNDLEKSRI